MSTEEVILDDDDLLKDRLLRSLHRNGDGHLSISARAHETAVTPQHNTCVLYIYTRDSSAYTLHEHYVYSRVSLLYEQWRNTVFLEIDRITKDKPKDWHGVYGWLTQTIVITPLRNGDLLIKIDKDGARGVRLTFNSRETKSKAHHEKARAKTSSKRNRV